MRPNQASATIESWWRHLGRWDLETLTGIGIEECDGDLALFFEVTDEWWDSLSPTEKKRTFDSFCEEV